jgi:SPFH domain / Band 7 family
MKRIVIFGFLAAIIWTAETIWLNSRQPEISKALALQQVNGGAESARHLREFEMLKDGLHVLTGTLTLLAALACFSTWIRLGVLTLFQKLLQTRVHGAVGMLCSLSLLALTAGCVRQYDRPEYVEIDTSETGFLIPLEGDSTEQVKFQSEDYLKQHKVATKRVQITHRWSQEGRWPTDGRWIPIVRLVKVNRSPVTREWMTMQTTASAGAIQRADKAIWIESGDSVGFSMGFTCTAFIPEEDASKFLYWYPSGSLADVMDKEVRARIQQAAAEVAAKYPLDSLRARKQEISDAVKQNVTNFFAARGVTITTVGMFGGMTYENPEIQRSIDQTFIAQQLKVVAEAKFEAQKKENDRLELEAQGFAEKARREAQGQADSRKTSAAGEAEAIRVINNAALEAQQNPLLLQLKALEVEKARIEKWDGRYPQMWFGANGTGIMSPNLFLQVPAASN